MQKTKLKLDWATYDSAKFACKNFHYSHTMPAGKLVKIGVWENDEFIGVVIFGHGANNNSSKYFQLEQFQICELCRIALKLHRSPVSRILRVALKMLHTEFPGIQLVFSYSDLTNQNHHGGVYQAQGWLYLGERTTSDKGAYYIIHGKRIHGRSARQKYGKESRFPTPWSHVASQTKHLYVKILNDAYVLKHETLKYPKRAISIVSDACSPPVTRMRCKSDNCAPN